MGFMRTGVAIVAERSGKMRGIVLEQMSGSTMDQHLIQARRACLDVQVIRQMLHQVIPACLDPAHFHCSVCAVQCCVLHDGLADFAFLIRQIVAHQSVGALLYWILARLVARSFCACAVDVHIQICAPGSSLEADAVPVLLQVFVALDAAQNALGFRHWDLRLANVMQHEQGACSHAPVPASIGAPEGEQAVTEQQGWSTFKMIDFGHGNLHDHHLRAIGLDAGRSEPFRQHILEPCVDGAGHVNGCICKDSRRRADQPCCNHCLLCCTLIDKVLTGRALTCQPHLSGPRADSMFSGDCTVRGTA